VKLASRGRGGNGSQKRARGPKRELGGGDQGKYDNEDRYGREGGKASIFHRV